MHTAEEILARLVAYIDDNRDDETMQVSFSPDGTCFECTAWCIPAKGFCPYHEAVRHLRVRKGGSH